MTISPVTLVYGKARTYLHFFLQYFERLSERNITGVELEDNIFNYLKTFVLLYADDTLILQEALDLYAF